MTKNPSLINTKNWEKMLKLSENNASTEHISVLATIVLVIGVCLIGLLRFLKAPYGRYHDYKLFSTFQCTPISARVGWVFMESPNLLIPGFIALTHVSEVLSLQGGNLVLLSMYIIHYIYR